MNNLKEVAIPEPLSDDDLERARVRVREAARDDQEAQEFLDMLGLAEAS